MNWFGIDFVVGEFVVEVDFFEVMCGEGGVKGLFEFEKVLVWVNVLKMFNVSCFFYICFIMEVIV